VQGGATRVSRRQFVECAGKRHKHNASEFRAKREAKRSLS
jgi:hypothetical protein